MYITFTESLSRILELIDRQSEVISTIDSSALNDTFKVLMSVRESLSDFSVNIVVIGKHGSGKSSLLNALFGKSLLPVCTRPSDVIIEVRQAPTPSATIYPSHESGKDPFDVRIEDLGKYTVDQFLTKEDNENHLCQYERIVLKFPLDSWCKNIRFVDFSGILHNSIALDYLSLADVILYCMRSQHPLSMIDKNEIEALHALDCTSICFVFTFFDTIEYNDQMIGNHDAEEIRQFFTSVLSPYTDFGSEGVFFVGSRPALKAKTENDISLLESSHLPKLEKELELMLNERGRIKLIKAIEKVRKANRDTCCFLLERIEFCFKDQVSSSWNHMFDQIIASDMTLLKECNIILEDLESITNELITNIWHKK